MIPYKDLGNLSEDERIDQIVEKTMAGGTIGFVVDDDKTAKRYLEKINRRILIDVLFQGRSVQSTTLVKIRRVE